MESDDLLRTPSDAIDDVIRYCRQMSLDGEIPVDVAVEHAETLDDFSDEVEVVYEISRKGLENKIRRKETVSELCFEPRFGSMYVLRTHSRGVAAEIGLNLLSRLRILHTHSKGDKPIIGNLIYIDSGKETLVTEAFFGQMAGGKDIPSAPAQIYDDFRK